MDNRPARAETIPGRTGLPPFDPTDEPALEKLSDRLYAQIFEDIVAGTFPPESRLPSEIALAQRFGVSRPIVREALARLRDHGFISSRQGSGSWVKRRPSRAVLSFAPVNSVADIQRCFEFRLAVEGTAAALAAERHDARALERVSTAYATLEEIIKTQLLGADADFAFHMAIAEAARNRFFTATLAMIESHVRTGMEVARNLSLGQSADRLRIVQDEHLGILNAIRARDARTARQLMELHIENVRQRMFEG